MRNALSRFILAAALLVVIGCAVSGGAMNAYKDQLGMATPGDLARETRLIFEHFHYEIEQEDSSITYQVYRTRWNGRTPFQDELDSGVVEARTRLIVTGRARGGGGAGSANVRVVEFVAENMVMYSAEGDWQMMGGTPLFREYVSEIANELKMRLAAGLRVF